VLDNSSQIVSGKNVQILSDINNNVTLRGSVKNEDEARLIEGVVRLTPGVGQIRNELLFPIK
jgi:osmotically-inducible protein OsmY